jgi:hypothetical protein
MAKTPRYVAYSELANHKPGAEVDPADFGGVDSDDFRYMLEHRTIVPMGDPDAPAPPDDEEEAAPAPSEKASTDSRTADQTVRQPGQAPAEMTSTGAVTKPTSGSSPASSSAAAAKPGSSAS